MQETRRRSPWVDLLLLQLRLKHVIVENPLHFKDKRVVSRLQFFQFYKCVNC